MDVVEYIQVEAKFDLSASPNDDIKKEIVNQILI